MENDASKLAAAALPALIDAKRLRCFYLALFYQSMPTCPKCGELMTGRALTAFLDYRRTSCRACKQGVHFFQNTPLQGTKTSPEQFFLLLVTSPFATWADYLAIAFREGLQGLEFDYDPTSLRKRSDHGQHR